MSSYIAISGLPASDTNIYLLHISALEFTAYRHSAEFWKGQRNQERAPKEADYDGQPRYHGEEVLLQMPL